MPRHKFIPITWYVLELWHFVLPRHHQALLLIHVVVEHQALLWELHVLWSAANKHNSVTAMRLDVILRHVVVKHWPSLGVMRYVGRGQKKLKK